MSNLRITNLTIFHYKKIKDSTAFKSSEYCGLHQMWRFYFKQFAVHFKENPA